MTEVKRVPTVSPLLFDRRRRVLKRCGNSPAVSVPAVFAESLEVLGLREVRALVLGNYLIYVPEVFSLSRKRQLLDLAMTALEALAMLEGSEEVKEAWAKLKELEDRWDAEEVVE